MSVQLYGAESRRGLAKTYQRSQSAKLNINSRVKFGARRQVGWPHRVGGPLWASVLRCVHISLFGEFAFFHNRTDGDRGKRKCIAGRKPIT